VASAKSLCKVKKGEYNFMGWKHRYILLKIYRIFNALLILFAGSLLFMKYALKKDVGILLDFAAAFFVSKYIIEFVVFSKRKK
jgi:hypothetical protein